MVALRLGDPVARWVVESFEPRRGEPSPSGLFAFQGARWASSPGRWTRRTRTSTACGSGCRAWFARRFRTGPTSTSRTSGTFGNILLELYAFVGDVPTFYQDNQARESRLLTATQRKNLIALTKLLGFRPAGARAATVDEVFTLGAPPVADVGVTAAQLAAKLHAVLPGVQAIDDAGGLLIESATTGDASRIEILGGTARAEPLVCPLRSGFEFSDAVRLKQATRGPAVPLITSDSRCTPR